MAFKPFKILAIVESIDVDDSSGSKANVALLQSLNKAGFEVKVLHYTRRKIDLGGLICIPIKENRRSLYFFLSRLERQLRYKLKLDLHKPLEKIFGFSFTLFNDRNSIVDSINGTDTKDFDLILTLSKGGSFRPHHAILQLPELHDKWMAYIHDPYPMHLYPRPYAWVEPGYMQKWKFVRNVSQKARYTAFPSVLLMEWMGSYFPRFLKTGMVIPHQIFELDSERKTPGYIKSEYFNVVHAGNLLHARNPKGLIEGFKIFISKNPEAESHSRLLLIGPNGNFKNYLKKEAEKSSFINIIAENRPLEEVDAIQKISAVNVILEAKSEISPFLPGKFPFCVAANNPILLLGPYYSECRRLLGNNYKYWSEIDDCRKIATLLEELYRNWNEGKNDKLDREDLEHYLSVINLRTSILKEIE